jgi:hypothetical protein
VRCWDACLTRPFSSFSSGGHTRSNDYSSCPGRQVIGEFSPGRLRGGLAASSSAPFASLWQNPTDEPNRCNLRQETPEMPWKPLYLGSFGGGRPLWIVCLGASGFPVPRRPFPSAACSELPSYNPRLKLFPPRRDCRACPPPIVEKPCSDPDSVEWVGKRPLCPAHTGIATQ